MHMCYVVLAASAGQPSLESYTAAGIASGKHDKHQIVFLRQYEHGKLLREEVVSAEELDAVFGPLQKRQERRQRRRLKSKRVCLH